MKRNQLVEVRVDAIPDVKFKGRIASISDATGASYSLIPQNNSAGQLRKGKTAHPSPYRVYGKQPPGRFATLESRNECRMLR